MHQPGESPAGGHRVLGHPHRQGLAVPSRSLSDPQDDTVCSQGCGSGLAWVSEARRWNDGPQTLQTLPREAGHICPGQESLAFLAGDLFFWPRHFAGQRSVQGLLRRAAPWPSSPSCSRKRQIFPPGGTPPHPMTICSQCYPNATHLSRPSPLSPSSAGCPALGLLGTAAGSLREVLSSPDLAEGSPSPNSPTSQTATPTLFQVRAHVES